MKNILITGGAGFIGSHLSKKLSHKGYKVKVLDNFSTGFKSNLDNLKNDIEIVEGDIRDLDLLDREMKNIEIVFHMAANPSVSESIVDPFTNHDINVNGTLSLLKSAVENNVEKFILSSSCAVYGDSNLLPLSESIKVAPKSPYALSKYINEHYCSSFSDIYDIKTVCLRYFNVYGPKQNVKSDYSAVIPIFISFLLNNKEPIIYGDGKQTRDFIFIDDVISANMKAMKSNSVNCDVFNVATSIETSLLDLINVLEKIFERKIRPEFFSERKGDIYRSYANIENIKKQLAFKPENDIITGVKKTFKYYQNL